MLPFRVGSCRHAGRFSLSYRAGRSIALLLVAVACVAAVAASSPAERVVVAQSAGGGGDCDDNPCIIWGLQATFPGHALMKINTCTGAIVAAPLAGPAVNTIAAGPPNPLSWPNLQYGDGLGGLYCTGGFPPSPLVSCGSMTATPTNALARDGATLYAGGDIGGWAVGCLFDPITSRGCGGFPYISYDGADLACDPSGQYGLMGEARFFAGGPGALFSISRGNGAQTSPRPPGGRPAPFSGLAYDGNGQLWASDFANGLLLPISPATGMATGPGWPVPAGTVLDLASDECNSCGEAPPDVGDAPDSTNHFNAPMTAYPTVGALFPSVIDLGTGAPPGPFHRLASQDSWLGENVTDEADADQFPDSDLVTNLYPPGNLSDRDGADDGVLLPLNLPACRMTQFNYAMTVRTGVRDRYTNVWMDFNHNGQWGDTIQCTDPDTQQVVTVHEWAVRDQLTTLGAGVHVVITPQFRSIDPGDKLWLRISLAETTAPPAATDGRGYDNGYEIGETEDYILTPIGEGVYE